MNYQAIREALAAVGPALDAAETAAQGLKNKQDAVAAAQAARDEQAVTEEGARTALVNTFRALLDAVGELPEAPANPV